MTTYAWPSTLIPNEMMWRYRALNKLFRSPLNGHAQTASRPGSALGFDMGFNYLTRAQATELRGFLAKLNGMEHWITIPFYGHVNLGLLGGTPVISGAGQTGTAITTSGWPNNTLVLKRGDVVSIGGEMKFIADDVTSSGAGLATLNIRPAQRIAPTNGSAIVVVDPTGTFMLENSEASMQAITFPSIRGGRASVQIIEVVTQP